MATAKVMTLKRRQALEAASTALLAALEAEQDPKQILDLLEREHSAKFKEAAHEMSLRCAGVRSTCTWGLQGLIGNWRKAATLRLMAPA